MRCHVLAQTTVCPLGRHAQPDGGRATTTFLPYLIADLQRAIERALALGRVRWPT
jgi:hypothetical protein